MRRFLRATGWSLISLGAFVLYFLVYQLVGTGAITEREQESLRQALEQHWESGGGAVANAGPRPKAEPVSVALGQPMGLIIIPKLKLEKVIVEGVRREDLAKGPGHIPETEGPGQPGTFAVSGHRTTYGAPFYRVNELQPGDSIIIVTKELVFTYAVTKQEVVAPTDVSVLQDVKGPDGKPQPMIVLTTCHPRYTAAQRLIVFGKLTDTKPNTNRAAA